MSHVLQRSIPIPNFFYFLKEKSLPISTDLYKTQLLVSSFQCHDRNGSFSFQRRWIFPLVSSFFFFDKASAGPTCQCWPDLTMVPQPANANHCLSTTAKGRGRAGWRPRRSSTTLFSPIEEINQPITSTKSINQSINQPINQSINQPINQSINQSIVKDPLVSSFSFWQSQRRPNLPMPAWPDNGGPTCQCRPLLVNDCKRSWTSWLTT